jgi:FAD/FMN-containing dehydrogenase
VGADAADFGGSVVALGSLGIVTSLTLNLIPTFDLRQYVMRDLTNPLRTATISNNSHVRNDGFAS